MEATSPSNALVPELLVSDWHESLRFYCDLLGFSVLYDRPEEGFAFLALGGARLMIDQIGVGRDFDIPGAPRERPFGRGVNLQTEVVALDPILDRLRAAGVALFLGPEERWYRSGDKELGQRQIIVADPDGYLLRLFEPLGERPTLSV
jgi:catechol 2,3-dioxygenase-like lactoylglutathione lyase family enzyme